MGVFPCCVIEVWINVCPVCGKREMWGYFPVVIEMLINVCVIEVLISVCAVHKKEMWGYFPVVS